MKSRVLLTCLCGAIVFLSGCGESAAEREARLQKEKEIRDAASTSLVTKQLHESFAKLATEKYAYYQELKIEGVKLDFPDATNYNGKVEFAVDGAWTEVPIKGTINGPRVQWQFDKIQFQRVLGLSNAAFQKKLRKAAEEVQRIAAEERAKAPGGQKKFVGVPLGDKAAADAKLERLLPYSGVDGWLDENYKIQGYLGEARSELFATAQSKTYYRADIKWTFATVWSAEPCIEQFKTVKKWLEKRFKLLELKPTVESRRAYVTFTDGPVEYLLSVHPDDSGPGYAHSFVTLQIVDKESQKLYFSEQGH